MSQTKPFLIPKQKVWEAWKCVKSNRGAAGIDGESISEFEANLKDNLYKVWNRMSSGSYFPPAVKRVPIEKKSGGMRILGVPTVSDRVAQTVAKHSLETILEPIFLPDSYGYRPRKSALDAVAITRQRCWKKPWVLEFDIKGLFDNIRHDLLNKALRKHIKEEWVLLYVDRWLKAPIQELGQPAVARTSGTPQGGCISPVLSNLFLHYVFDAWMTRCHESLLWCRYADDGLIHCSSKEEAEKVYRSLKNRFSECGLELHPLKTRIICCDSRKLSGKKGLQDFTFLGYSFRMRKTKNRKTGEIFQSFQPAISKDALQSIKRTIKYQWRLKSKTHIELPEIARRLNPVIRGWYQYYGRFYKAAVASLGDFINEHLRLWAINKYSRLWRHRWNSYDWLRKVYKSYPNLFAHWKEFPVY